MSINLSWNEDIDDLLEWCEKNNVIVNKVSAMDLADLDSKEFIKVPAFTSTEVVSRHLENLGIGTVDTYDVKFNGMFRRRTWKGFPCKFPVFIKPVGNGKDFDGTVVSSLDDLAEHLEKYDLTVDNFTEFNMSEIVTFEKEKRVLCGGGVIYNTLPDWIPKEFVKDLLTCAGTGWFTVDVGWTATGCKIVEINPPYSIDSMDIDIDQYMRFCIDYFVKGIVSAC